jgi:LytS/YehU family sensor histidine kinase
MNNQIEIIEVADQYINTIAMWTGTRAAAINQFIKANQLDAVKLAADLSRNATEERKDFASAISGYADNEYLINLRKKYKLAEGFGEQITNSNKQNKRYKITEIQLKMLLDRLLQNRNDIENEDYTNNEIKSLRFRVKGDFLFNFIKFIDTLPSMTIYNIEFDGDSVGIIVTNLGKYDDWQQLFDFYQNIK